MVSGDAGCQLRVTHGEIAIHATLALGDGLADVLQQVVLACGRGIDGGAGHGLGGLDRLLLELD